MRVFLAEMPTDTAAWEYSISSRENLGLGYLAAVARAAGHHVKIVSGPALGLTVEQVFDAACKFDPQLVGVSLPFTDELEAALSSLARLTEHLDPNLIVLVGGHAATASWQDILARLPTVRAVVLGEGETTFREVLECVFASRELDDVPGLALRTADGYRVTAKRDLIRNPDTLPFPARDVLHAKRRAGDNPGEIYIAGSRGCPYRCSFCDIKTFYKNGQGVSWRCRSPDNVVEELRQLSAAFGTNPTYCFVDDQFLGPGNRGRAHAHEFADHLIESDLGISFEITCRADSIDRDIFEHLKRAGLAGVYIGLDSGSQAALDRFQKDISVQCNLDAICTLRELDLAVDFGFIMFDPWTTTSDLLANLSFLGHLIDMGVVLHPAMLLNGLKLYPNTPIAARAQSEGRVTLDATAGLRATPGNSMDFREDFQQLVAQVSPDAWSDSDVASTAIDRLKHLVSRHAHCD